MSQESINLNQYQTMQQKYEANGSSPYVNIFIGENSNTDIMFTDNYNYQNNDFFPENENTNNDVYKNSSFYNQENINFPKITN